MRRPRSPTYSPSTRAPCVLAWRPRSRAVSWRTFREEPLDDRPHGWGSGPVGTVEDLLHLVEPGVVEARVDRHDERQVVIAGVRLRDREEREIFPERE